MPEIFTPTSDDQMGRLALIEAIRANTDAVNRLSRHSEMQDRKFEEITTALARIDTRLALLERDDLRSDVEDLQSRIKPLEDDRQQRKGAMGLLEWWFKNWPAVVGFVGMIMVVLIATGKVDV
ncbi:hypothetical protein D6851_02635 [Altericroceibacterium spongiae]|uniref:Uncharacterized protein n=1 Tax=Altericroceibacterium spongiae TaxID=2320269 RepID=A0A420ERS9_9SPHN|nr:hypothetical protein [Altericroceibacterium spongiae]RKF23387.1 hypothetical protein D6851_02635 [Altericroceibacterium spongiae]